MKIFEWGGAVGCALWVTTLQAQATPRVLALRRGPSSRWCAVTAKTYDHTLDGPLGEAIVAGKTAQVQSLLQRGADPNAKTAGDSATPMLGLAAIIGEPLEITRLLVEAGADLEAGNARGDAPLVLAAIKGNVGAINFLLKSGAKVEANADNGRTALMFAAATGHTAVVQALIQAGANVNAHDNDKGTPLIYAASKTAAGSGNLAIATLLVEAGADVSVVMPNGNTAIKLAQANGLNDIAAYLDTIRERDEALLQAAAQGNWKKIKAALAQGANPRYQTTLYEGEGDDVGRSATAAMWLKSDDTDFDPVVAAQILARSDLEAHEKGGDTALVCAVVSRDLIMTRLLIQAGANVNVLTTETGKSPLMLAVEGSNLEMVKTLVAAGAQKDAKTSKGETALSLARDGAKTAIIQFLQAPEPKPADDDLPDLAAALTPTNPPHGK